MPNDIEDMLSTENVKDVIDKLIENAENMESLLVAYTTKNGSFRWEGVCRYTEGMGMSLAILEDLQDLRRETREEDE
jgi:hypothetical protein